MEPPARRPLHRLAAVVVGVLVVAACGGSDGDDEVATPPTTPTSKQVIIGEVDPYLDQADLGDDPGNGPGVDLYDSGRRIGARAEPGSDSAMVQPDGHPTGPPIPFTSARRGVDETLFVLVVGSDARRGERVDRSRADSVHIVAVNPALRRGTIVGIPRDAWMEVPGRGSYKVNTALALGGPQLLARTISGETGIELDYYVLTGFDGIVDITNALGGVNVLVERRMNDRNSGARFERGWHLFEGVEVLAYSRNRKDVAHGDFSRSENQGRIMLATLAKMRAEIGEEGGLQRWLGVLREHVQLDIGLDDLVELAVTARRLDPAHVDNVVASGTIGTARGQSVVFLDDEADALFRDVAADGVIGSPPPAPASTTSTSSTTTSTTTTAPSAVPPVSSSSTSSTTSSTSTTLVPFG